MGVDRRLRRSPRVTKILPSLYDCSRCGSDFVLVDRFLSRIVRGGFRVVRGRIWGVDLLEKVGCCQ